VQRHFVGGKGTCYRPVVVVRSVRTAGVPARLGSGAVVKWRGRNGGWEWEGRIRSEAAIFPSFRSTERYLV